MSSISSGTSLLEAGRRLAPVFREHSEYGDENGRLAPEVVDAFFDAGLFGMWVPEVLGGSELDPVSSLELTELISYEDPSAGWVLFTGAIGIGMPGVYLPDAAVDQIFAGDRILAGAGQGTRAGKALPVDGGYRLSGEWNFASSAPYASYILTLAVVEGTNEPRIFIVPVEQVTLDPDSWDVLGLRATGSWDYSIDDVFVPDEFTYFAGIDGHPVRGGAVGKLGLVQTSMTGHSGWALGVGRRLLDEFSASMRKKAGRAGAQAGSDSLHEQYANAEAQLRSARALLYESWTDVWETLSRGDDLSKRQSTLIRLALHNATWSAFKAGSFVYVAAGTNALRPGTIQRFYRDIHAGAQHILSAPPVQRSVGRELAGLADGQHWSWIDLADDE
jgi:alkylation response protein AidB-like acyl-CoA dehydrogenase